MSRITSTARYSIALSLFAITLIAAPQVAFAQTANNWSINMAESKFGDGTNRLVLDRQPGAHAPLQSGSVVLISHGSIYLATPGGNSGSYGMSGMNLERIGGNVHVVGYCGLICQSSPNSRLVLSFTAVNGGPHDMSNAVVFNGR